VGHSRDKNARNRWKTVRGVSIKRTGGIEFAKRVASWTFCCPFFFLALAFLAFESRTAPRIAFRGLFLPRRELQFSRNPPTPTQTDNLAGSAPLETLLSGTGADSEFPPATNSLISWHSRKEHERPKGASAMLPAPLILLGSALPLVHAPCAKHFQGARRMKRRLYRAWRISGNQMQIKPRCGCDGDQCWTAILCSTDYDGSVMSNTQFPGVHPGQVHPSSQSKVSDDMKLHPPR